MSGPVSGRRALFLVGLLLASSLLALVPTAAAVDWVNGPSDPTLPGAEKIHVKILTLRPGGNAATTADFEAAANDSIFKIGTPYRIGIFGNLTRGSTTDCAAGWTWTATADLDVLGGSTGTQVGASASANSDTQIAAISSATAFVAAGTAPLDGVVSRVTGRVTGTCPGSQIPDSTGFTFTASGDQASSNRVMVDRVVPTITSSLQNAAGTSPATVKVGDAYRIAFSGASADLANYDINLPQLTPTCVTECALTTGTPPALVNLVLEDTGFNSPQGSIVLTDARGNQNTVTILPASGVTFDAGMPLAPSLAPTAAAGPTITVPVTTVASQTDLSAFLIRMQPPAGAAVTMTCPGAECAVGGIGSAPPAAGGTVSYSLRNATLQAQGVGFTKPPAPETGFATRTTYQVSVAARDAAGNVGPFSAAVPVTTVAEPIANVMLSLVSGTGGIGTQFTLAVDRSAGKEPRDADVIQVDLAPLIGGSAPNWQTVPLTGSATFTVVDTNTNSVTALTGRATAGAITGTAAVALSGTTFDADAPVTPADFAASALPSGAVRVTFTGVSDAANYRVERNGTTEGSIEPVTDSLTGCTTGTCTFDLAASLFKLDTTYQVRVRALDAKGNPSAPTAALTVRPANTPLSITLDATPSLTATAPLLAGDYIVSDSATPVIEIAMKRGTSPVEYWSTGTTWTTTATYHPVASGSIANGRWQSDLFQTATTGNPDGTFAVSVKIKHPTGAAPERVLADRAIQLDRSDPSVPAADNRFTVNPSASTASGVMSGATRLTYALKATDAVGLSRVEFRLMQGATAAKDPEGRDIVITCSGTTCVSSATPPRTVGTLSAAFSGTSFTGTATFVVDRAKVGAYTMVVRVFDTAGNSADDDATEAIRIVPRLRLVSEDVPSTLFRAPFVDANGLRVNVLAAFDAANAVNPEGPCEQSVCRVTAVEIYGRDRTSTTSGTGTLLANIPIPVSGPSAALAPATSGSYAGDVSGYFDYSPTNLVPVSGIAPDKLEIRAKAIVSMGSGAANQHTVWSHGTDAASTPTSVPWLRVPTTGQVPGITFGQPADNTTVFLGGNGTTSRTVGSTTVFDKGRIQLNLTFQQVGLDNPASMDVAPWVNYSVLVIKDPATPANEGKYLDFTGSSVTYSTTPPMLKVYPNRPTPTTLPRAPLFGYDWANTASVPRGEYFINATVQGNSTDTGKAVVVSHAQRVFWVETLAPTVTLTAPVTQPEIFSDKYVRPTFNVTARIDHNLANLTSAGLRAQLIAPNLLGPGTRVLNQSQEGFEWTLHSFTTAADGASSTAVFGIKLPGAHGGNLTDGNRFDVRILASMESLHTGRMPGGGNFGNASAIRSIEVDLVPPGAGVYRELTNQTGFDPASALELKGFAEDRGSGVKSVEVRIYDPGNDTTLVWNANGEAHGGWLPGNLDSWFSSETKQAFLSQKWVRNVILVPTASPHVVEWKLVTEGRPRYDTAEATTSTGTWDRLPLDRNTTYVVQVRARDQLAGASDSQTFTVLMDSWTPVLTTDLASTSTTGFVGWQDRTHSLSVGVQDNQCLKQVALYGRAPSGRVVGPFEFARPAGLQCGRTTGNAAATWTLALEDHPLATDEVGRAEYWVEAKDPAGNLRVATRTLNLTVNDTQRATVSFLRAEPPTVSPGGRIRVVAEVWENSAIEEVRAFLSIVRSDNTFQQVAQGKARPLAVSANGSGEWVIETDTDLAFTNLAVGDWLVTVRAVDKNANVTCVTPPSNTIACHQRDILIKVSGDAGISVLLDAPSSTATFVNATPTFRYKVFDRTITASGITLKAGNSTANLTTVTPTSVTDLPLVGANRTGLLVEYRPNLANESTITVQLVASSNGLTNTTTPATFAVDAIAPTVTSNATGTVDRDGVRWVVPSTRVALNATDARATTLTYTVNGGAPQTYTTPITPTGADGDWRLEYVATDAAGNAARGNLTLRLDGTGPAVTVTKNGDEVVVTVTDAGVGLNESTVRVFYAYGRSASFTPATMERVTGTTFRALLPGNATATGLKYHFEAKDLLGTTGTRFSAGSPHVILPDEGPEGLPPTLEITSPLSNAAVRGSVDLRWTAADPEGEPVTITIAIRTPTAGGRILQAAGENNGTWTVDVSTAPAGAYTLVVTASDGNKTTQESVVFLVERGEAVELVTSFPNRTQSDRLVPITIRVNSGKAVQAATYTVTRDNVTFANGTLRASQGAYSANVVTGEAGYYTVSVALAYADGTSEPARQIGAFTVASATPTPGPGPGAFPASLMTLVVLAVVTIGLAAYAAFVRWPR